jgi:outer membrane receptor protein involved in Fe transport
MFEKKRSRFLLKAIGVLVMASAIPSLAIGAEDPAAMSLEDLLNIKVSVASKQAEDVNDAPGIITVISKQEIDGFAAETLGDVLNRVVGTIWTSPDVFIDQSMVMRAQDSTAYNNHVLFLINGRPVRDPSTGGFNQAILNGFPLTSLDHIEIIRGPGSVLYGSCAFSGVVNLVTRTNKEEGLTGSVGSGFGSYDSFNQHFASTYQKGDLSLQIGATHRATDGPTYEFKDYSLVTSSDNFNEDSFGLVTNIIWDTDLFNNIMDKVTANLFFSKFDPYSLEGSEFWTTPLYEYVNSHTSHFGDLGTTFRFGDATSLDFNFTYNYHEWGGMTFTKVTNTLTQFSDTFTYYTGENTPSYSYSYLPELTFKTTPVENLNCILGGGMEFSNWEGERFKPDRSESTFAYTQLDYSLKDVLFLESLKLIGGVQYNKIEKIDANYSPRVGAIAHFTDNMGIKALYSEAFRKGYPRETHFNVGVFRGNPELEPEEIKTTELEFFYNTPHTQSSVTFYMSEIDNQIIQVNYKPVGRPDYQYVNQGNGDFMGVEYEGKWQFAKNWLTTGAISYQENESEKDSNNDGDIEKYETLHPRFMSKVGLLYDADLYSLGMFLTSFKPDRLTGREKAYNYKHSDNDDPESYNLLSLKATCDILHYLGRGDQKGMILSMEGANLLDQEVNYPDYHNRRINTFMPLSGGRTFLCQLAYTF